MPTAKKDTRDPAHPPFIDMIKEAIVTSKERTGISRIVIKNYIETNYNLEMTTSVVSNISRALKTGSDKQIFVFPKGPSGKVKLAPKKAEDAPPVSKASKTTKAPISKSKRDRARSSTKENKVEGKKKTTAAPKNASTKVPKVSKENAGSTAAKRTSATKKPLAPSTPVKASKTITKAKAPPAKTPAKTAVKKTSRSSPRAKGKAPASKKTSSARVTSKKTAIGSQASPKAKPTSARKGRASKG